MSSKIILFDMDNTLTKPRTVITDDILESIKELIIHHEVGIVTGSDFNYIENQLYPLLTSNLEPNRLHLFSCNGTKYYKWINNKSSLIFENYMVDIIGNKNYQELLLMLQKYQLFIMKQYQLPYTGTFIQYRGSMLNWCPIGRDSTEKERNAWIEKDRLDDIRNIYVENMRHNLKALGLHISLGGSTSFDIFPIGWDKTYVLNHLSEYRNIIFVGDSCQHGGNDYELFCKLKQKAYCDSFEVKKYLDTIDLIKNLIKNKHED